MSIFKSKLVSLLQTGAVFLTAVFCCVVFLFPIDGYADEADTTELIFSQNLYHKHTGSSSSKGGCYTVKKTRTKTEEEKCQGTMVYYPAVGRTSCDRCGASYEGDKSSRECWTTTTKTVTETYYDLGCNMSANTQMGTLTVRKSTDDWTKSLTLQAFYEVTDKVKVKENPFIWNGADATSDSELVVTENGTYTLQLNAGSNVNTKKGIVTIPVNNIDKTGPAVLSSVQNPLSDWTREGVMVDSIAAEDRQPDGTYGCGLHEEPFSFDGGKTWTEENAHFYTENGTYEIMLRDKLENVSGHNIHITNIDVTPPTANVEYDKNANLAEVTIFVNATDVQPDGSNGCGLHEEAYSYDGGKTWRADSAYTVCKNGKMEIAVRDKLENICHLGEDIGNIDDCGPRLLYTLQPDSWTKENVVIHLEVEDKNADGSNGIGLPQEWYSLDGGNSWQSENTFVAEENKTISLVLRDIHDNRSQEQIVIDKIDRVKPKVSIEKRKHYSKEDGRKIELIAKVKEKGAGLAKKAYSWNGAPYSKESSIFVSSNGTYTLKVCDAVGNVGKASIEINSFPEDKGEDDIPPSSEEETTTMPEETRTADSTEEEGGKETPDTTTEESESEEETQTESMIVVMEELGDEPESVLSQEVTKENGNPFWKWLLTLMLAFLFLVMALFALFAWLRTIAVYVKDAEGRMHFMGRRWIHLKEERYEVRVSESMFDNCETGHFCFKPAWGFVQLNEESEIYFHFPESICISRRISEKMEITVY